MSPSNSQLASFWAQSFFWFRFFEKTFQRQPLGTYAGDFTVPAVRDVPKLHSHPPLPLNYTPLHTSIVNLKAKHFIRDLSALPLVKQHPDWDYSRGKVLQPLTPRHWNANPRTTVWDFFPLWLEHLKCFIQPIWQKRMRNCIGRNREAETRSANRSGAITLICSCKRENCAGHFRVNCFINSQKGEAEWT